jgi:hypothetical protein
MGGRTDGLTSILTANSPQQLIDELALQRAMGTEMTSCRPGTRRGLRAR